MVVQELDLIINLRGGGCCYSSKVLPTEQVKISHNDIFQLILQRGSLNLKQELKDRVKIISSKIPMLIEGNIKIINQFVSLLIFEQFGQICLKEFQLIQKINYHQLVLRGLKYQYDITITSIQKQQKIQNDQDMIQLQRLQSNLDSVNDLINHIKNIELELTVSESFDFKNFLQQWYINQRFVLKNYLGFFLIKIEVIQSYIQIICMKYNYRFKKNTYTQLMDYINFQFIQKVSFLPCFYFVLIQQNQKY
ncbi:unnamed protein product (macronuclear) [Paramecium tetraurelia]|uniref:Uncharacterized protein n=1 Tax=Paramecium tetraurelia TaxID=5888 RepID=A0BYS5_PARTE|nr:uncharacterized protein GSPATT00033545001 [Paramecium tetraurelia]CAK63692.1 unnamed protein product [Paramecium tetraurelia]|eukprot:XP_001431090.1 hypothetical protein (macronuclear) [Paramecium tetraurelia strain d4-2]